MLTIFEIASLKLIEIKNKAEISSELIFIDGKIHPSASKI